MLHTALHFLIPALLAAAIDRKRWLRTWLILIGTMAVDVDHLLAVPVYDPERCSIGFHPLHTTPAIIAYGVLLIGPWVACRVAWCREQSRGRVVQLVGLGLIVHMVLDGIDCLI